MGTNTRAGLPLVSLFADQRWVVQVLESEIERACVKLAKEHRCILLKIQKVRGWPDRLLLAPNGKALFLEFKAPGLTLRPLQAHFIAVLNQMGHPAQMVSSVEQFKQCLTDLLAQPGNRTGTKNEE